MSPPDFTGPLIAPGTPCDANRRIHHPSWGEGPCPLLATEVLVLTDEPPPLVLCSTHFRDVTEALDQENG